MGPGSLGLKSPTLGVKVKTELQSASLFEFNLDDRLIWCSVIVWK